jgi:purine-binding chemotaxis protein CheW
MALNLVVAEADQDCVVAPQAESGADLRLLCRSGKHLYAIPLESVVEVMRILPIERLAGAPPYVRGLSIIRGAPVPVVDIGLLIGNQATQSGRLVTLRAADRIVAIQVETVLGSRAFAGDTFRQLPPLLRDVATETVTAIGSLDAELLLALHSARLVSNSVFAEIDHGGRL